MGGHGPGWEESSLRTRRLSIGGQMEKYLGELIRLGD